MAEVMNSPLHVFYLLIKCCFLCLVGFNVFLFKVFFVFPFKRKSTHETHRP